MRLIILSILQSMLLCGGQVFLKFALRKMGDFHMSLSFIFDQLANMYWVGCGVCYGVATILWMYIIKNFPFSMAYPMISLSYILGMFAAVIFFHESIPYTRWAGVLLIMAGCVLVAK